MPQTRQHIQRSYSQQRQRHSQTLDIGVRLTRDGIERFMTVCQNEGRVEGTLKWYRRGLNRLYDDLPEDKTIRHGTLERWREKLVKEGYAPSTINSYLSVNNAYLDFVGHREYQLANQLKLETELQPELTRTEYLRLLQTARALDREKVYLLVKLFGNTDLPVQELENVTVGAVQAACLAVITLGTLLYTIFKSRIAPRRVEGAGLCLCIGLVLGIMSSFLGIGGGPINLVVLFFFFGMDTKTAAQNSLYIILFSQAASLAVTLLTRSVPEFEWGALILMVCGGIGGGIVGRLVNKRISVAAVDKLFMGLMGVIILISVYNTVRYSVG